MAGDAHGGRCLEGESVAKSSADMQIRSLPDMEVVLESEGVSNSEPSFTDDYDGTPSEFPDRVKQMLFHPIGRENPRPHVTVSSNTRNSANVRSSFNLAN